MYVERVFSSNNGWLLLTTHKNEEWQEAKEALAAIDDTSIIEALGESDDDDQKDDYYVSAILYLNFLRLIGRNSNWNDLPHLRGDHSSTRPRKQKNGLSAFITGFDELSGGDFLNSLYLHATQYHALGVVDVTVIFIPTTEAVKHIQKITDLQVDIQRFPNEKFCREQFFSFAGMNSDTPCVLAFFSPVVANEIAIEEFSSLKIGGQAIERTIEFAPEYYQAGVGLLSYFGEVLRQKDPNTKAKVRIEQDGRMVRLHIESPSGDIETIERELDRYALVISNQAPPETLFENRMHIMQLESKLEVAKVELKNAHDLKQLTDGFYSQQIRDLKQQVDSLTQQIATQLLQTGQVIQLVSQQSNSHERIVTALIDHSQGLFKDMLHEASGNQQLTEAVESLRSNLMSGIATIDIEEQLDRALSTIKQEKPGFLGRMASEFKGAAYKVGATSSLGWVVKWIATHLPK